MRQASLRVPFLAIVGLLGLAQGSRAEELNPRGQPDGVRGNQTRCYFVWEDSEGYHVRFTSELRHRFSGEVRVASGSILKPAGVRDGAADKNETWWGLSDKAQTLKFDLQTRKTLDGLDFKLGNRVKSAEFLLKIDGEEDPARIFVGSKSISPKKAAFTVPH